MTTVDCELPVVIGLGAMDDVLSELLEGQARVIAVDDTRSIEPDDLERCQAFVARGAATLSGQVIASASNLRVIARTGVGVESIDVEEATRRGVPVMTTPGANSRAVAEGVMAMALSLTKQLTLATSLVRQGRFAERDHLRMGDLEGASLGIVGLGHVGRHVARFGQVFGMTVSAYDPYVKEEDADLSGVARVGILSLLDFSNVLVTCAPHSAETAGLLDRTLLGRLPRGAIYINVGRGSIVDLDVLHELIVAGHLGGVGLDVFDPEPPAPDHPLFSHPNVVLSPHAFGLSTRARQTMYRYVADGLIAVLRGERPGGVVNPEVYLP